MEEIWKDIEGFEDHYKISNLGNVYGKKRKRNLKPSLNSHGYYHISLWKNGKEKKMSIHRLIGLHFIPNPENKPTVDHIDQNPINNDLSNLRWYTQKEQLANRKCTGGRAITKGGYYKHRKGFIYQWREYRVHKWKSFKTLELAKAFEIEHLKRLE